MRRIKALKVAEEYSVLESMLSPFVRTHYPTYRTSLRKLRELHRPREVPAPRAARPDRLGVPSATAASASSVPPLADPKLSGFLSNRNLTGKDIDSWLQINVISTSYAYDVLAKVDTALEQMIAAAGPTALWAIMQFLAKYWEVGVMGERPLIRTARGQAQLVLLRVLETSHKTTFAPGGANNSAVELVGLPSISRVDRFVSSLFEYMALQRPEGALDPLDDLLFRLHARCGPVAETQARAKRIADSGAVLSGASSQELLSTLSRLFDVERDAASVQISEFRARVRSDLEPLQHMLVADITPGSLRFMLVWLESPEELWELLDVVEQSPYRGEVYRECQLDLVRAMERFGLADPKIMAQATGLISRIAAHTKLGQPTRDYYAVALAKAGNAAGVQRALRDHPSPAMLGDLLGDLLDAFPLRNFGSTLEQSRVLVAQLRSAVPPQQLHKWISAYGRAGGDLSGEWAALLKDGGDVPADVLLAFLAAPATAETRAQQLQRALVSEFRTHIIDEVRAHDLVDSVDLDRVVATFAMNHPEVSDQEIDAMLPGLEDAHHVARTQTADQIWPA